MFDESWAFNLETTKSIKKVLKSQQMHLYDVKTFNYTQINLAMYKMCQFSLHMLSPFRGDYFRFSSVFIKKNN
jgi:3-oxoacyl-[acyl-carrier-protein] synthase III